MSSRERHSDFAPADDVFDALESIPEIDDAEWGEPEPINVRRVAWRSLDDVIAEWEEELRRHAARPWLIRRAIDAWRNARHAWRALRRPWPWTRLRWRQERARRGWSDRDVWNLDTHLAEVIAGSVMKLRDNFHAHPPDLTPDEWRDVLTRIAEPLETYAAHRFDVDESPDEMNARDVREYEAAQEALRLMADWFGALWD